MEITVEEVQGKVPVTIMNLQGDIDASNYQKVIVGAKESFAAGRQHLILDLSGVSYMSSSGLAALHTIAVLSRGEQPPDLESGWSVFKAIDRDRNKGTQQKVKLLNPQPAIERILEMSGMQLLFEIHTDREAAIASF